MNILIITTYYPPDTSIAAVRPYMFAKYLSKMGHKVTVLRSGLLDCAADRSLADQDDGVRVISYMGMDSPAERFERGEEVQTQFSHPARGTDKLPYGLRKAADQTFRTAKSMMVSMKVARAKKRFALQKVCIDALAGEHFDAVFATYNQLENIYAGKYAAEKFGCKWILDLRDPIARRSDGNYMTYLRWKRIQEKAVCSADICTAVSDGVAEKVCQGADKHVVTLYNGYDDDTVLENKVTKDEILRFCYTGVMYKKRSSSSTLFCAIRKLADEGKLEITKVQLEYAGPHFDMIREQAKHYNVESILVNHGYVSRAEAAEIQARSDVFLVLTWNTEYERGVLTGKFFEGIRARKPILTLVSGNVPNSELYMLNEKYHYGFCYEECANSAEFENLYRWVEDAYNRKQKGLTIDYLPKAELYEDFTYRKLAEQLESIIYSQM